MAKKTISKKIVKTVKSAGKRVKTAGKKTLKSNEAKTAKLVRKKLGKGLEDISTLFLSGIKKNASAVKKKIAESSAKKPQKTKAEKSVKLVKVKSVRNKEKRNTSKRLNSIAVKKTVVKKKTNAKSLKTDKAISRILKKTAAAGKNVSKKTSIEKSDLKDKKTAEKKPKSRKTASKLIMKKTEVVRMGSLKKSSQKNKKPIRAKAAVKKTVKSRKKKVNNLGPISELKNLLNKKKIVKQTADKQNDQVEQVIADSKFYAGKASVNRINEDEFLELPEGYGDNRIVIQVRDPYWLFAYWEVSQRKLNSVVERFGDSVNKARRVLRVYDITSVSFDGNNANGFFDIDVNDDAKDWYVNAGTPGRSYCVDIGFILPNGRFVVLARSNFVTTPIDAPSMVTDEEWMIVEEDFNKLYGLSAGLGAGLSSGELGKQIRTRLKNLSSGVLSSPSAVSVSPKRDFWMVVNTELIVYGATQPGAQLLVQGKPIKLNEDGTFSLRFALADGEQVIPVRAISPDKIEERIVTSVVKKNTV